MNDAAGRMHDRMQLTSDGHGVYLTAVESSFGVGIDYAQLIKLYGNPSPEEASRYSPGKCLGAKKRSMIGSPAEDRISTSYAERQNLNIRMQNRRFTRLTNAFSKKAEMLAYSVAITTSSDATKRCECRRRWRMALLLAFGRSATGKIGRRSRARPQSKSKLTHYQNFELPIASRLLQKGPTCAHFPENNRNR